MPRLSAWERRKGVREELERALEDMGFADAVPADRHPQKASLPVIRGFAGVYGGYAQMAEAFWEDCAKDYMGGFRDIMPAFRYREEL